MCGGLADRSEVKTFDNQRNAAQAGNVVSIKRQRPIALRENRQWQPTVAYCRYADDFVVIVKGTKAQARAIREECRAFLEGELKLTLNMEKPHVTHVNDGFTFLGHRLIRKRGPRGTMRPVTTIPRDKLRNFAAKLTKELSGNYSEKTRLTG